jgi:uncharacterized protein YdaU (DUF1376 family)
MANHLHTMPLKIERLLSSQRVRMLELDEFGAYIHLLCDAWLNGCKLPNASSNARAMQKLCACNAEAAQRIIDNVLHVFFEQDENGDFYNVPQCEIWNEVHDKSLKAKQKAEFAAAKRWGKVGDASSIAQAMPQTMHKQCLPKPNPKPKKSTNVDYTDDQCLQIYQAYPKKVAKQEAFRAIAKALKKLPFDELLAKVKEYAAGTAGLNLQYIPNPATWFNGERWNDETPPQPAPALFPQQGRKLTPGEALKLANERFCSDGD